MKTLLAGAAALALLAPVPVLAQSIAGTWKADIGSAQAPKQPEVYILTKTDFTCQTCTPKFTVKADGQYHQVDNNPYYDMVSIRPTSNGYVETEGHAKKIVGTTTVSVSSSGTSATVIFSDSTASTTPVKGTVVTKQVAPGPKGSLPGSGSWVTVAYADVSDNGTTVTYKIAGDSVTMSTPGGQGYTAKLGGPAAPYKGDPGTDTILVKMDGKSLVETTMRGKKVSAVTTTTPSADGKSLSVKAEDKLKGSTMSYTAKKM